MNELWATGLKLYRRPLVRDTGWLLVGQSGGLVLQAVYFGILARLLGVTQYGIFVGAFAFTSIVANYSSMGTGMVLLRYVSSDRKAFPAFWGNVLLTTLSIGAVLSLVLTLAAGRLLNSSSAALVAMASIANCICAQLITETGRVCRAFEQTRITAGLSLLTSLLRTIAVTAMLMCLHRANAWQWTVASMLVSAIGATLAVAIVTARFGRPLFDSTLLLRHCWEGLGYSFAQSTTGLYNDVDKTMLCSFGFNEANGIYTVAYRMIDIATIPISSLQDAALPKLFQLGRNGILETRRMACRLLRKAVPFAVLTAASLGLAAPILPRIVGGEFAESVSALRWLCLIPVFRSVHNISGAALTGAGLQKYRTVSQVLCAGFNIGLNILAIPHYGWLGAAWSSLITDGSLAAINWVLLIKLEPKGRACEHFRQNPAISA